MYKRNLLYLYVSNSELHLFIIYLLSLSLIFFGLFVIISKNPIVSVFFLIILFLSVSIYLILTGLIYIGISYLLVYIGAVSILFLFTLMLIDIRISELLTETNNNLYLSINISILFLGIMYYYNFNNNNFLLTYDKYVFSNTWEGSLVENTDIISIGNIIYTNLFIWLIISLLILLLAMVGAIKINIK
jgi:NADH-ubiquinone oxidoreductase chain 6